MIRKFSLTKAPIKMTRPPTEAAKEKTTAAMPRLSAIFKGRANYSAAATAVNVAVRFVPTAVTAVMITTAMSEAISPYSIAVTTVWSFT